jgi:hypothetical protein
VNGEPGSGREPMFWAQLLFGEIADLRTVGVRLGLLTGLAVA